MLTGKYPENRSLGRHRRSWEDNVRIDIEAIGINTRNWADSTRGTNYCKALLNATLNLRVP